MVKHNNVLQSSHLRKHWNKRIVRCFFNKKAHKIFIAAGLTRSNEDFCLYHVPGSDIYLIIWVDDFFLFFAESCRAQAAAIWKYIGDQDSHKQKERQQYDSLMQEWKCQIEEKKKRKEKRRKEKNESKRFSTRKFK